MARTRALHAAVRSGVRMSAETANPLRNLRRGRAACSAGQEVAYLCLDAGRTRAGLEAPCLGRWRQGVTYLIGLRIVGRCWSWRGLRHIQQVWTLDVFANDRRITVPSLVVGVNYGQLLTLSVTSPVGPS